MATTTRKKTRGRPRKPPEKKSDKTKSQRLLREMGESLTMNRWKFGALCEEYMVENQQSSYAMIAQSLKEMNKETVLHEVSDAEGLVRKAHEVHRDWPVGERFEALSFSHHVEVKGVRNAKRWLERAEKSDWSVLELRKQIKKAEKAKVAEPRDTTPAEDVVNNSLNFVTSLEIFTSATEFDDDDVTKVLKCINAMRTKLDEVKEELEGYDTEEVEVEVEEEDGDEEEVTEDNVDEFFEG